MEVGACFDFGSDSFATGFLVSIPSSGVGHQASTFADERDQFFSNQVHSQRRCQEAFNKIYGCTGEPDGECWHGTIAGFVSYELFQFPVIS